MTATARARRALTCARPTPARMRRRRRSSSKAHSDAWPFFRRLLVLSGGDMPANCCHPIGAHKRLRLPDTYVSSLMLDRALDAIARRAGSIDRDHDIPYLAGY